VHVSHMQYCKFCLLRVHERKSASGNIFEKLLDSSAGYQAFIEYTFLL